MVAADDDDLQLWIAGQGVTQEGVKARGSGDRRVGDVEDVAGHDQRVGRQLA